MSHANSAPIPEPNANNTSPAVDGTPPGIARSPWAFWLPLLFQSLLILWIPAQAIYTLSTGKTVVLQTAPVDPYDLMRGYYVTLSYDISNPNRLAQVPGWDSVVGEQTGRLTPDEAFYKPTQFYVVLQAPDGGASTPPAPWVPVRVSRERPTDLPNNQIALQGQHHMGSVIYDLERYYIPEDQREQINGAIANLQQRPIPPVDPTTPSVPAPVPFVVEIKVGANGQAVPLRFWLEDQAFRF